MRESSGYAQMRALYQAGEKQEARVLFRSLTKAHGYRAYDLCAYTKQWNKRGSFLSIGSSVSQQLSKRACQATEEYRRGTRGRPRFKGFRGLSSIEDKSIDANLRFRGDVVYYRGLDLPLLCNFQDPIHAHGLGFPVKYVRLVQRSSRGGGSLCIRSASSGSR